MGLGLDTFSDPFTGGEAINTEYNNIVLNSFGKEKKRDGLKEHSDSSSFTGSRVSNLFFWVETNLSNSRAWVFYDRNTGQIKIKEG